MLELPESLHQAVADHPGMPVRLIDPHTQGTYVLLPAEVYDQLLGLLGKDFQPSDAYPAIDRTFKEGWDDPKMDEYDRYEEFKK
jgi:hypothetical protein